MLGANSQEPAERGRHSKKRISIFDLVSGHHVVVINVSNIESRTMPTIFGTYIIGVLS